jgi:hypothetical protein
MNRGLAGLLFVAIISVNGQPAFARRSLTRFIERRLSSIPLGSPEMRPDQVNIEGWNKAWTNLVNVAEQSFTPSLPRLKAVEVELLVGNNIAAKDELTLTVLEINGSEIVSATQLVHTFDCEHPIFVSPGMESR